jgi:hypothetical protein
MSLLELFCDVDDFMLHFTPSWKAEQLAAGKQRERAGQLCPSEIMTILIHFHQSHYRTFKAYYMKHVQVHLTNEFPHLVSYQGFIALIPSMMVPMLAYLQSCYGSCTGISFIDSTSLEVCDPKRISQHRVFATDARRGKTSTGWFYGFKLHLAVNDRGELLACCLTPGNVDDRAPVPDLVKHLRGKLFADRGYISTPLTQLLFEQGLHLITRLRKNMRISAHASFGQAVAAQTSDHRVDYRSTQEYLANRALSSSQSSQFCRAFGCRTRGLLSSRQKAWLAHRRARAAGYLMTFPYPELTFFRPIAVG